MRRTHSTHTHGTHSTHVRTIRIRAQCHLCLIVCVSPALRGWRMSLLFAFTLTLARFPLILYVKWGFFGKSAHFRSRKQNCVLRVYVTRSKLMNDGEDDKKQFRKRKNAEKQKQNVTNERTNESKIVCARTKIYFRFERLEKLFTQHHQARTQRDHLAIDLFFFLRVGRGRCFASSVQMTGKFRLFHVLVCSMLARTAVHRWNRYIIGQKKSDAISLRRSSFIVIERQIVRADVPFRVALSSFALPVAGTSLNDGIFNGTIPTIEWHPMAL